LKEWGGTREICIRIQVKIKSYKVVYFKAYEIDLNFKQFCKLDYWYFYYLTVSTPNLLISRVKTYGDVLFLVLTSPSQVDIATEEFSTPLTLPK